MFSISIQAGGQSFRMGRNKALMNFKGQPLIVRIIERVTPLTNDLFITSNEQDLLSFLNCPVYEDVIPGAGALGGLITAFHYAKHNHLAILACDMPFINPKLILTENQYLLDGQFDVVIPKTPRGLEPLHAIYRIDRCLPAALESLRAGKKRLISWFPNVRVREVSLLEMKRIDPDHLSFLNINTVDEFRFAESLQED